MAAAMLRVLTLSTLFPNAGQPTLGVFVERQTLDLAARPGVEVEVVAPVGLPLWPFSLHPHYSPRSRLPAEEEWKGLKLHRPRFPVVPVVREAGAARALARSLLPLLRSIRKRFQFDVIDCEFFWPDAPAAMALARALGVPFSAKARGADVNYWGDRPGIASQIAEAGQAAGGLLAVSEATRERMIALGMPGERIRVHHTGVDLDLFRPLDRAATKAALGLFGPTIVTAGALIPRKGQTLAIEALALLPGAELVLIGEGPDRAGLDALARSSGVADRVRFTGALAHEDLPLWLAAADVALQPSSSEGLANVWVEALACGTPVVTTEVGGAREAIDRPEAGRIVAREAGALAAAIRDLLAEPPEPDRVRAAATRFSWERNAAELHEHLAGIVKEARSSRAA